MVPGWDEHFVGLVRENSKAAKAQAKAATVEGQLERRRQELFAQGAERAVDLRGRLFHSPPLESPVASAPETEGEQTQPLVRGARPLPESCAKARMVTERCQ